MFNRSVGPSRSTSAEYAKREAELQKMREQDIRDQEAREHARLCAELEQAAREAAQQQVRNEQAAQQQALRKQAWDTAAQTNQTAPADDKTEEQARPGTPPQATWYGDRYYDNDRGGDYHKRAWAILCGIADAHDTDASGKVNVQDHELVEAMVEAMGLAYLDGYNDGWSESKGFFDTEPERQCLRPAPLPPVDTEGYLISRDEYNRTLDAITRVLRALS